MDQQQAESTFAASSGMTPTSTSGQPTPTKVKLQASVGWIFFVFLWHMVFGYKKLRLTVTSIYVSE